MSITYVSGNVATVTNASAITGNLPAGIASGDFMLASLGSGAPTVDLVWDDDGGGGKGWIRLDSIFVGSIYPSSAIYYKFAGSSETAPTFTLGGSGNGIGCNIIALRGVDSSSPFSTAYNQGSHFGFYASYPTPLPLPIATAVDQAWVLLLLQVRGGVPTYTAPTNYILRQAITATNRAMAWATREIATATTESPGSWGTGLASPNSVSYTLAIRPYVPPTEGTDGSPWYTYAQMVR